MTNHYEIARDKLDEATKVRDLIDEAYRQPPANRDQRVVAGLHHQLANTMADAKVHAMLAVSQSIEALGLPR